MKTVEQIRELTPFEKEVSQILEALCYGMITKEYAIQKILAIEVGGEVVEECPNQAKHWYLNPIAYDSDKYEVPCSVCGYTGRLDSKDMVIRPKTLKDLLEGK